MTPIEPPPADLGLVRRLAGLTLALGQAEAEAGPEGWRRATSYLLGALALLVDRHSAVPGHDLALAAERLAVQARALQRAAAPWPPRLGQQVWLIEQDVPGRVLARCGAGLSFRILPDGPGQYPVRLILRELAPLVPIPGLDQPVAGHGASGADGQDGAAPC